MLCNVFANGLGFGIDCFKDAMGNLALARIFTRLKFNYLLSTNFFNVCAYAISNTQNHLVIAESCWQ